MTPQARMDIANAGRRVLVVDDEIEMRFLLAERFRSAGFVVAEACDAGEASALLGSYTFDAVITDVQMPGPMDGIELAESIRTKFPHTFVVVVSGRDFSQQLDRTDAAFFRKPYLSAELIDFVKAKLCSL